MSTPTAVAARAFHRPAGSGATYLGPADYYTFLVTGEESGGAYFAMEALIPPGGGPPPHIHRHEDETFYVVEGNCTINVAGEHVLAGPGDFVNIQRGVVHHFKNEGTETARMILTFSPAGMERFFEETLRRALGDGRDVLEDVETVAARYAAAAPKYGLEFL